MVRLIDSNEIKRAYSLLVGDDQVVELRILEASVSSNGQYRGTYGGYFNNVEALLSALSQIQRAKGIYITLQICKPNLIHRTYNELVRQRQGDGTSDNDIVGYKWLLIDSDPDRDPTNISSSHFEHASALQHSRMIAKRLSERGWPAPIIADSGNGGHLLYRIDLDPSEKGLVERVLKGLASLYDASDVHIDQTVYNPARICKLYGTLVCKGANTTERPHRMSRLLEIPEHIEIAGRELLEEIATPSESKPLTLPEGIKEGFTAESFIQKYHIDTYGARPYAGGTRWQLKACIWDSSHTDRSACVYQFADGRLGASCSHNGCKGKGWREFRMAFEPDAYTQKSKPRQPEREQPESSEERKKEPSAQMRLMKIAKRAKFINTASGALYARVPINGHVEVVSINEKGSGFRRWLVYEFNKLYDFIPNSDALSQTMAGIQAIAEYEGEKTKVYTRIAEKDGCVYLDLANEKWECIEISQNGWKVMACPPVYFRRPSGMLPLPVPERGGNLNDLRTLIHAKSDKDYILIMSWLIGALHPTGPYPVLNLNGERGSTKSKTTTILRNLIDPNEAPARNAPKDERDAAIAAQNNMVVALDNLSSMPLWLSDVLCRIATGSGFATRELYSDDSERVFNAKRPVILNGIEDGLITQGDLLNRTVLVTLEPPQVYRSEEEIDSLFRQAHPRLLGSLLTIASQALRNRKKVQIANPPRMADFARWVTAAEQSLKWEPGTFMSAYQENQDSSSSIIVESSPVAKGIMQFMGNHPLGWEGLTKDLLIELQKYEVFLRAKTSPKTPNKLSGQLKRVAPSLRIQGIDIQQPPRQKNGSHVILLHLSDVDKNSSGVDKTSVGVDKNSTIYTTLGTDEEQIHDQNSESGVDGVDKIPHLSPLYPPNETIIDEVKEERPDREGILSTLSSPLIEEFTILRRRIETQIDYHQRYASRGVPQEFLWNAPGCKEFLKFADYLERLDALRENGNVQAAIEAMQRTLGEYSEK